MDNLPRPKDDRPLAHEQSFLAWHYSQGLSLFLENRLTSIAVVVSLFDIPTLVKNLFKPYRRMTQARKLTGFNPSEFFDRISFNIISRLIGATDRILFIFAGILGIAIWAIFNFALVGIWAIFPFLTLANYWNLKKNTPKVLPIYLPQKHWVLCLIKNPRI